MRHGRRDDGFTLIEVLAAMAVIVVALTSLAGVIVLAARVSAGAGTQSMTARLAAQKVEELRASGAGSMSGPAGSLVVNVPGYSDWLDFAGRSIGVTPGPAAVYVRRWATGSVPGTTNLAVVQVLVSPVVLDRHVAAAGGPRTRHRDEALVATCLRRP